MMCSRAKEWLLQAALPEELAAAPPRVAAHLRTCDDCQRVIQQLHRAERDWREEPLPASAHTVRDDFLRRHADEPTRPTPKPGRRRLVVASSLVAASLLLAVTMTTWFMSRPNKTQTLAQTDVIERLIDWNLELTESPPADRQRIYASRVESLRAELDKLPPEDHAFAVSLLSNGEWLASNAEPLEEADRFNTVADEIVERMNAAATSDDAGAAARTAKQYERVATLGIEAKIEQAATDPGPAVNLARQQKLDKLTAREDKRIKKLEKLQDTAPAPTRKEIRKLIEQSKPKGKKNPGKPAK